jgi:hypothetical protein
MYKAIATGLIALTTLFVLPLSIQSQKALSNESNSLSKQTFVGTWIGEGYHCPWGTRHTEKVEIKVNDNFLIATKITGDDCVPAGSQTFSGKIPNQVLKGTTFNITFTTGLPSNPASSTSPGQITVVNSDNFIAESGGEKIIFTRE